MIVIGLVTLDVPLFYFCLYRERNLGGFVLGRRLRPIRLTGVSL